MSTEALVLVVGILIGVPIGWAIKGAYKPAPALPATQSIGPYNHCIPPANSSGFNPDGSIYIAP